MGKRPARAAALLYCTAWFLLAGSGVFAFGAKEEPEKTALNNEWTLSVTRFDISALPESRRSVGDVFNRSLVDTFKAVNYRIRVSPEYAYYEGYAWAQSRSVAAKALAAKQDERALLLYRGDAGWRYRREIKKIDADIVRLREDLDKAEAEMPLINGEPVFSITQGNVAGNFPEVPEPGRERRFCAEQKADAFLAGAIREYHNRYYVTLRLYALYTDSVVYTDEIIFSADDISGAVEEIAGRLSAVLAGSLPAAIAVNAEPEDTLVLINRSFAGRGTVAAQDRPPGTISIELSAPDHKPETVEVELHPGELTRVHVNLWPEEYGEVTIQSPGVHGAAVYHGARYAGEAPLTLRLPLNQLNYVSVEGPGKQMAQAAFITPEQENTPYVFSLKTRPLPAGKDRVNKARKAYYWSWGGTWITGIAAWVVTGILKNNNEAILERWAREGTFDDAFYDQAELMQNVYYGAWAVAGAAAAFEIYQMARYIYTATEDTTPVLKPDRQEKNQ